MAEQRKCKSCGGPNPHKFLSRCDKCTLAWKGD